MTKSIAGIVVEYNPMHNGHLFHLEQTKKMTNCDSIVAVMSGNFVQRGEPAFINKWARTKMALMGGVDLVLELPLIYSISSAEGFAFGAISTLDKLGVVDYVCFGSETGDIIILNFIANILSQEPASFKSFLQNELKSGISFPKARQNALTNYIITNNFANVNPNIAELAVQSSNNILAIEYIKALIKISSNIKPITINRVSNNYNDVKLTGNISSATSIRHGYINNLNISAALPDYANAIIDDEIANGRGPVNLDNFSDIILYKIRTSDENFLKSLLDIEVGLNFSLKKAAEDSKTVTELLEKLKNKRYTKTRLQRILLYALLDITSDNSKKIKSEPDYIRVLGFNSKGKAILNQIKKDCSVPIISSPSAKNAELLKHDILATDTYVLGYNNPEYKFAKQDLKTPPVILYDI
jgi:predicted nucleotidyltransferase